MSFAIMANTLVGLPLKDCIRVRPFVFFWSLSTANRNVARDKVPLPTISAAHSAVFTAALVAMLTTCSAASPC